MQDTWVRSLAWEDPLEKGILVRIYLISGPQFTIIVGIIKPTYWDSKIDFKGSHISYSIDLLGSNLPICLPVFRSICFQLTMRKNHLGTLLQFSDVHPDSSGSWFLRVLIQQIQGDACVTSTPDFDGGPLVTQWQLVFGSLKNSFSGSSRYALDSPQNWSLAC